MTGGEHYREAEQHLHWAAAQEPEDGGWMSDATRWHLAAAQVHATLAHAAAAARTPSGEEPR